MTVQREPPEHLFDNTGFEDVVDFHTRFGLLRAAKPTHLTNRKLKERFDFMQEELTEFAEAASHQNMEKLFDALIDLVYVAMGTAVMMGLPWDAGWHEVQRANMAKVRGVTHRGHAVDVTKPPGWAPPDLETVLRHAGYVAPAGEQLFLDDLEVTHAKK